MKVSVPVLVKDRGVAEWKGVPLTENFTIDMEDRFLDGPVTRRVAVLDFDDAAGALRPGAGFVPPDPGRKVGRYDVPADASVGDLEDPNLMQVVVFGGVDRSIAMFEEPDTLGRSITWAFPARASGRTHSTSGIPAACSSSTSRQPEDRVPSSPPILRTSSRTRPRTPSLTGSPRISTTHRIRKAWRFTKPWPI